MCYASRGVVRRCYDCTCTVTRPYSILVIYRNSTQGPLIGGLLSRPHEKYPELFDTEFWRTYPYFLPCACSSLICLAAAVVVGLLFEEVRSLDIRKNFRGKPNDPDCSVQSLPALRKKKKFEDKEYQALAPPRRLGHQRSSSEETLVDLTPQQPPIREILTRPVVVAISNYAVLSLIDIALTALIPLFYSTPIADGGLGLSTPTIGLVLSALVSTPGACLEWVLADNLLRVSPMVASKVSSLPKCSGTSGKLNPSMSSILVNLDVPPPSLKNVYVGGVLCFFGSWACFPIMNSIAKANGIDHKVKLLMFLQLALNIGSNTSFGTFSLSEPTSGPRS